MAYISPAPGGVTVMTEIGSAAVLPRSYPTSLLAHLRERLGFCVLQHN